LLLLLLLLSFLAPPFIQCLAHTPAMESQEGDPFPLAALPIDTLANVLRWVPQQQRFYNCAVVCKAWQAAAAAATRDLQMVPPKYTAAHQRFHTWLLKHSGNVKSLTVTRAGNSNSQHIEQVMLPLKQLSGLTSLWATNGAFSDGDSAALPEPAQEFSRSISSGYTSLENGFAHSAAEAAAISS
jgi:hypothetical protein